MGVVTPYQTNKRFVAIIFYLFFSTTTSTMDDQCIRLLWWLCMRVFFIDEFVILVFTNIVFWRACASRLALNNQPAFFYLHNNQPIQVFSSLRNSEPNIKDFPYPISTRVYKVVLLAKDFPLGGSWVNCRHCQVSPTSFGPIPFPEIKARWRTGAVQHTPVSVSYTLFCSMHAGSMKGCFGV